MEDRNWQSTSRKGEGVGATAAHAISELSWVGRACCRPLTHPSRYFLTDSRLPRAFSLVVSSTSHPQSAPSFSRTLVQCLRIHSFLLAEASLTHIPRGLDDQLQPQGRAQAFLDSPAGRTQYKHDRPTEKADRRIDNPTDDNTPRSVDKMGRLFHGAHTHGRAFHGEEARRMLALHRRDSHGDKPVMNVPADQDNKMNFIHNSPGLRHSGADKAGAVEVQTVESVVYVTQPQTFGGDAQLQTASAASPAASHDAAAAYESAKAAAGQAQAPASSAPANTPAEASSTPTLRTVPEARTRTSSETSQSLQTAPPQVSLEGSSQKALD